MMGVCWKKPFIHWNPKKHTRWHILPNLAGDSQAFLLRFPLPTRHSKPWGEASVSSHPFTSLSLLPQSPRTQHQPPSPSSSNKNKVSQVENNVLLSSSHLKPHVASLYPSPPCLLSVPQQWQGTGGSENLLHKQVETSDKTEISEKHKPMNNNNNSLILRCRDFLLFFSNWRSLNCGQDNKTLEGVTLDSRKCQIWFSYL